MGINNMGINDTRITDTDNNDTGTPTTRDSRPSGRGSSFADLLAAIRVAPALTAATRRDYAGAIARTKGYWGRARLEDIPLDLAGFRTQFPADGFDPALFKTEQAYRAWRKKVVAAIKGHLGILADERARRERDDDDWAVLLAAAAACVANSPTWNDRQLIPLRILAAEARTAGLQAGELTPAGLAAIAGRLVGGRRRSCLRAAATLDRLCAQCAAVAALLPPASFGEAARLTRAPQPPAHLVREAGAWIACYCEGERDEIMGTHEQARAPATRRGYDAALRKYLGTAQALGLLDDARDLGAALSRETFNAVMRAWILAPRAEGRISKRSMSQYVLNLRRLARNNGIDVSAIDKGLRINRELKAGRAAHARMSQKTMRFCAWLLSARPAEMLFRSLHVRFFTLCRELLAAEHAGVLRRADAPAILQLGALAAMAAIEVWGPPLRIDNLRGLRLYGERRSLFVSSGGSRDLLVVVPKEATKTKETIRQRMRAGDNRAVEILRWFIREIRPRFPGAQRSEYLFPGFAAHGGPLTDHALRGWLATHGRRIGIVMTPHDFRHGIASLYLRAHPGGYDHIARLLDNSPDVVRRYYAWIDDERVLAEVQEQMLKLAGFGDDAL